MTSTLPGVLAWPMLTVLLVVALLRALFLHTQLDQRLTATLVFWAFVALLRDPQVQDVLARHLTDPSVIRQATHMCAMLASAALFGAVILWGAPEDDSERSAVWRRAELQSVVYTTVFVMGLTLFPLSAPARAAGQTLEEHGGWQVIVYMIVYSAPTMVAVTVAGFLALETALEATPVALKVSTSLGAVACAVSLFDAITRIINACFVANHTQNAFTEWRGASNDSLFLPEVTVVALVLTGPLVHMLTTRLGIDQSTRRLRRLDPMWKDMSAVMPKVVLQPRPAALDERADRVGIEIFDAIGWLGPYLRAGVAPSHRPDLSHARRRDRSAISAAIALQEALDGYRTNAPTPPAQASTAEVDSLDIDRVGRVWEQAKALRGNTDEPTSEEGRGLSAAHG